MSVLLEGKANFNTEEKAFLELVSGNDFPWYHMLATQNFPCLFHTLVLRLGEEQGPGRPWSDFYPIAKRMFDRLCSDNNINVRTIYRMAFNLTFADPSKHGDPHSDHAHFEHKIMIIYLSDFDNGETFLFDNATGEITEIIKPERDKFVIFEGGLHAQGFCRPRQHRIVFVVTFDGDVVSAEKLEAAE